MVLLGSTLIALAIANSPLGNNYHDLLHQKAMGLSIEGWINDGLMTIFFLMVGLELEREIYVGELRSIRKSILPVVAAIGGMMVPAAIHLMFNYNTPYQRGAGIPTATDIAFSLALLSFFASRVSYQLKIFLTAVAIADDLGAVVLIAVAYSDDISLFYLGCAIALFAALCVANRLRVNAVSLYVVVGVVLWYCMMRSGVHATIAGVMLSFAIPFRDGGDDSPSYRLQHSLHRPVAFGILPIFALANTGIEFPRDWMGTILSSNSVGIIMGLCLGKPVGIVGACYLMVKIRLAELPSAVTFRSLTGASIAAGIGFTMSIFVSNLAFEDHSLIDSSRVSILISLFLSAAAGTAWFHAFVPPVSLATWEEPAEDEPSVIV